MVIEIKFYLIVLGRWKLSEKWKTIDNFVSLKMEYLQWDVMIGFRA